jgi:ribosomal protein S6--L-glutamate ligase
MSKILILSSKLAKKNKKFVDFIVKDFQNRQTKISIEKISSLYLSISQGSIFMEIAGKNIKSYDLVYLRGITGGDIFDATLAAICLKYLHINYFDTLYSDAGPHRTKLGSLAVLASHNLPIPKTVFFADKNYVKHFGKLSKELGVPFIAKEMSLQRGKGVHFINSVEDLKNLPKRSKGGSLNEFFFQEFIDKDHEYRILTLGKKVGVWEEKVRTDIKEFRNNVALGASEIFMDPGKIPQKLAKVAIGAADALGIEIAGVDVMTAGEKVYVLEVNRGPGLTYDEKVSPEFKVIAKFFEKEAKG